MVEIELSEKEKLNKNLGIVQMVRKELWCHKAFSNIQT